MTDDERLGLPLSLVEALRADSSPVAATLADLLEQEEPPRRPRVTASQSRPWQALLTGLALSVSLGVQSHAATLGLKGRWIMAPAGSQFQEAVTGPAPDAATLTVVRDDDRFAYALVESRGGEEVAQGAYDVSLSGEPSTSSVDGVQLAVHGTRDAAGDVLIQAPEVNGARASIRLRRTGRDTLRLEHDVSDSTGAVRLETISLIRSAAQ